MNPKNCKKKNKDCNTTCMRSDCVSTNYMNKYANKYKFRYIRVVLSEGCSDKNVEDACWFIANSSAKALKGKVVCTEEVEKDGSPKIFTVDLNEAKKIMKEPKTAKRIKELDKKQHDFVKDWTKAIEGL